jgi:2-iminoacetate synthase
VSFVAEFNSLPRAALVKKSLATSAAEARAAAGKDKFSLVDFAALISPAASDNLEALCRRAQLMTQQRFGKVIRLFAPLYLSNECINNCSYCGFSRDNPILRVTLSLDEMRQEAQALKEQGFRNILLVAGEHPKFVSNNYLRDCIAALHADWPSISLEVGPMETEE